MQLSPFYSDAYYMGSSSNFKQSQLLLIKYRLEAQEYIAHRTNLGLRKLGCAVRFTNFGVWTVNFNL